MQKRSPALSPGLLFGIAASLLLHGSLFGMKSSPKPAVALFDSGDVSVELTLVPSIASHAEAQPIQPPVEVERNNEPIIEIPEPTPPIIEPEIPLPMEQSDALPQELEIPLPLEQPEPLPQEPAPETPEPALQKNVNSVDQEGSLKKDKGAFSAVKTQSQCSPIYPRMSRRRGEEGTAILSVEVSASGKGSNIQIIQSSGHSRLDKAAIKALKKAKFTPAVRFGKPQASILTQSFKFEINDGS